MGLSVTVDPRPALPRVTPKINTPESETPAGHSRRQSPQSRSLSNIIVFANPAPTGHSHLLLARSACVELRNEAHASLDRGRAPCVGPCQCPMHTMSTPAKAATPEHTIGVNSSSSKMGTRKGWPGSTAAASTHFPQHKQGGGDPGVPQ